MKREIITNSARETRKIGKVLAEEIMTTNSESRIRADSRRGKQRTMNNRREGALVIGLEGDLGSGKTTFIQGMAKGLGVKELITSPTFVILRKYKTNVPSSKFYVPCFYHIDCYRIKSEDLLELGFEEIAENPQNIIVIEWAERVKRILKNALWLKFEYVDKDKRKIVFVN